MNPSAKARESPRRVTLTSSPRVKTEPARQCEPRQANPSEAARTRDGTLNPGRFAHPGFRPLRGGKRLPNLRAALYVSCSRHEVRAQRARTPVAARYIISTVATS